MSNEELLVTPAEKTLPTTATALEPEENCLPSVPNCMPVCCLDMQHHSSDCPGCELCANCDAGKVAGLGIAAGLITITVGGVSYSVYELVRSYKSSILSGSVKTIFAGSAATVAWFAGERLADSMAMAFRDTIPESYTKPIVQGWLAMLGSAFTLGTIRLAETIAVKCLPSANNCFSLFKRKEGVYALVPVNELEAQKQLLPTDHPDYQTFTP